MRRRTAEGAGMTLAILYWLLTGESVAAASSDPQLDPKAGETMADPRPAPGTGPTFPNPPAPEPPTPVPPAPPPPSPQPNPPPQPRPQP
ncbi:protein of unknown function [Nitrospira japonica]|uniref:Uncharacterized protein n=2 Tax=Nitrospira japonica TaxID=1325564 RepID=A0A1W1I2T6_9BACT|nr:protein of unknown function [Nitrospira japonica]